jgi:putative membrane protein
MILDAALSFLHFTFVLILAAAIGAEAFVLRLPLTAPVIRLLARIDLFYGLAAGALVAAGFSRVYFGAGDEDYYLSNHAFWGKMAAFAAIGVISIWPTMKFIAWSRAVKKDAAFAPPPQAVKQVRLLVTIEAHLLLLVVLFAVMMARGFG